MDAMQLAVTAVFLVTVGLIIWGKWDRTAVGIAGVVVMVVLGNMTETEAFGFVDWNVIAILLSVWIIASYFGKSGVPEYLAVMMLKLSRNSVAVFLTLMGVLSGFISMFVDNVVVILMMAPVVFHITKKIKVNSFPFLIFVGLSANFMGTAMLLGDLPPQMLHSVSGIEFNDFLWFMGRPSSFILLTITFLLTAFIMHRLKFKKLFAQEASAIAEISNADPTEYFKNWKFTTVSVGLFIATVIAMSFRQQIGHLLGFIALAGMIVLVMVNEVFSKQLGGHCFADILKDLDFGALIFYVVLFILVGGLDHAGVIKMIASGLSPLFQQNIVLGSSLLYWITAPIVGIVEHDAYILVFLYLIKDLAASTGLSPWPLYWTLLWAGTLGSNLTIAGAPALFVAQSICEKEDNCKVRVGQFLTYSVPFVVVSLLIQFVLAMLVWVIPFAS